MYSCSQHGLQPQTEKITYASYEIRRITPKLAILNTVHIIREPKINENKKTAGYFGPCLDTPSWFEAPESWASKNETFSFTHLPKPVFHHRIILKRMYLFGVPFLLA